MQALLFSLLARSETPTGACIAISAKNLVILLPIVQLAAVMTVMPATWART